MSYEIFSDPGSNTKLRKSDSGGKYLTLGLSLAPSKASGVDVCTSASPACRRGCLHFCGYGRYVKTKNARIKRTKLFHDEPLTFRALLYNDLDRFVRYCLKRDIKPVARLNVFSDIVWENVFPGLFRFFPQVQFYDYTKHAFRCMQSYSLPDNYHLTFSRSEINHKDCRRVLRSGKCNLAVVFGEPFPNQIPNEYMGRQVIVGEYDDLRFLDPPNSIVGLKAKGKTAKEDSSGFVVDIS